MWFIYSTHLIHVHYQGIPEDVAFAESRIRKETIAAEDIVRILSNPVVMFSYTSIIIYLCILIYTCIYCTKVHASILTYMLTPIHTYIQTCMYEYIMFFLFYSQYKIVFSCLF